MYAFTSDGGRYVLVASRGPDGSEPKTAVHSSQLLCWSGGSTSSSLPATQDPSSVILAARAKAPIVHTAASPYKDGPLPLDWQELAAACGSGGGGGGGGSGGRAASSFATVPLMHGREALGAVLIAAPGGRDGGALAAMDANALQALGLALSLYTVADSADAVLWLAGCLWNLLDAATLQQAVSDLCGGVAEYISMKFMLQCSIQATLLAEPESQLACMVHGSSHVPSMSEPGLASQPGGLPNSALNSLRGRSQTHRRSQLTGVRRILAETASASVSGLDSPKGSRSVGRSTSGLAAAAAAANAVGAVARASYGGAEELEGGPEASRSSQSQQSHAFCMPEQRVLRARTFKLAATLFQKLVADGGAPRGVVVEDCARHVQDVHKPTRDVSMLIQSAGARCLVLTGTSLSNGATLGLYLCFASRMPLRLLNAVHVAAYELLSEALRPCVDAKICGELQHEFDILKAGVPGVYLATTTAATVSTSGIHPRISNAGLASPAGTGAGGGGSGSGPPTGPALLTSPTGGGERALASPVVRAASSTAAAGLSPSRRASQPTLGPTRSMKSPLSFRVSRPSSTSSNFLGGVATSPGLIAQQCEEANGPGSLMGGGAGPSTASHSRFGTAEAGTVGGTSMMGGFSSRGGGMAPGTLAQVAKLDVDDSIFESAQDSGSFLDGLMQGTASLGMGLGMGLGMVPGGGGGAYGAQPLPIRASSLIRVQELDASTAIRNQMGVLVSSFQASLQDSQLDRLMGGRSSTGGGGDDLDQLQLVSLLGRGGNGIVLRGLLAQVAVAVKLIGMPDPEPANENNTRNGGSSQPSTPGGGGGGGRSHGGIKSPAGGGRSHGGNKSPAGGGAGKDGSKDGDEVGGGGGGGGSGGADGLDISPSEALSRRRELARGAMELAVLTTTSHPCLVQVFSYYTNVVLEEGGAGPTGDETYTLRRYSPQEEAARCPSGAPPPMVFTAVCMEWCDQGSMHDAIGTGRYHRVVDQGPGREPSCVLDMEAIYLTLLEVAMSLRYLHARRIIHRDVKPGNVLLKSAAAPVAAEGDTRGYNAKLADFGFAMQLDQTEGDKAFVVPDQACGSVPYMAPETFRSGSRLDGSVDVYAFGIVMWEAVAGGEQPYTGVPNKDIPREVYRGRRPGFRPDVPYAYRQLAQACWAAQPSKRPTAAQLVTALKYNLQLLTSASQQQQHQQGR
ncbi:hypothetical protein HYH02_014228 [Chlamydomonas schloesseri]|uniref:Protein kinase domain-containing protein n=1 Tax=Chlamydomonas schloesseri TaxID=2026947 RepID=A0A835VXQ2_9CHLO|nr:hypothetical protein HYH02_014228 [Chlamydomonas schloesseri]|eukprot:KAG2428906.1 hypothetical protein HYH02_014228 [Chlamydomonas schloesseri]